MGVSQHLITLTALLTMSVTASAETCEDRIRSLEAEIQRLSMQIKVLSKPSGDIPPATNLLGFRETRWGMTVSQVADLYPQIADVAMSSEDKNLYLSRETFMGQSVTMAFRFVDGALWSVQIPILYPPTALTVVDDYERLRGLLAEKYGKPDRSYMKDHSKGTLDPNMAAQVGMYERVEDWKLGDTQIGLGLTHVNGSPVVLVDYNSTVLEKTATRKKTLKALDEL